MILHTYPHHTLRLEGFVRHAFALALVAGRKTHAAMVSLDAHRLVAILRKCGSTKAAMTVEDADRVVQAAPARVRIMLLRMASVGTLMSLQPAHNVAARVFKARPPVG